jgi:hypothetical protein
MGIVRRRRAAVLAAACGGAVASLAAALPAHAQSVPAPDAYLARMDVDGDRRVSLAEYQAWMGYGFDAMDRDHDGVLSAAELPGGVGPALDRAAHRARLAAVFSRQDRDHDGYLNARELSAPP